MVIEVKPDCPLVEVQLLIGDTEEELISGTVIQYILDQNDNSVGLAAIAAAKYIVSDLTKMVDEEVGDIEVNWSQLLDNYKKLLDNLVKNPIYGQARGNFIFGGTRQAKYDTVKNNSDAISSPIVGGEFSSTNSNDDEYSLN